MPVTNIKNKAEFDAAIAKGSGLVVVDFYADWCGPCKMISPKFEEFSSEFTDVTFLKVNVDECDDVAAACSISAMPTFQFYKNNKKVDEMVGATVEKLKELIKKHK